MNFSTEMYEVFCKHNNMELTEEAKPGIEGSITMVAEAMGEIPEWMASEPVFENVLEARKHKLEVPVEPAPEA